MRAEDGLNSAGNQQSKVGERAKRAVAQDDVARLQFAVQLRDARHVVRAERSRQRLLKQPAAEMNQRQPMGGGEAAARRLSARLSKVFSQFVGGGHRKAGAVQQEQAMPQPES